MTRPTPGSLLAKGLGIDPRAHKQQIPDDLVDRATTAISPFDKFLEDDPTVKEWILEHVPTKRGILSYLTSFFPFVKWIGRYNTRWLTGDLIAGEYFPELFYLIAETLAYLTLHRHDPCFSDDPTGPIVCNTCKLKSRIRSLHLTRRNSPILVIWNVQGRRHRGT